MKEKGLTLIHPFDDPYVIAGQATIGMEIMKQISSASPLEGTLASLIPLNT
jgi:threonine dehydratase